ncbi:N-6 DNA methylase [Barnesiella viscericola]|uniref:N-6 DNA methylase n=1 Tax=Barnesiella viscericola TaxID=397865 RepID=UPI003208999E
MFALDNKMIWAKQTGLLPIHLDPKEKMERFIMLDGGYYDFCLDLADNEDINPEMCFSKAWSTNTKNYVIVDNKQSKIIVHNWLLHTSTTLQTDIVTNKFNQFVQILNRNTYKSDEDLVPFVLGLFRQMRNLTGEKNDSIIALNLLYRLLISLQEDINKIDCDEWKIEDVQIPAQFDYFVETIRAGVKNITPDFDLILRHCSGPLFQEAHREVSLFNQNRDLFGGVSSSIEFALTNYSSIHYTPQYLARSIVENAIQNIDLNKESIKILDPACGSGAFLLESLKILKDRGYMGKIHIIGWDCSPSAISTVTFLLNYEQRKQWGVKKLIYDVKLVEDSLLENWDDDYDLIVMNPPFLAWELIKSNNSKDAILSALTGVTLKKRPNQAAAFFYQAINSLAPKGVLGAVLPSSILLLDQYAQLRDKILQKCKLRAIARLGNFIFEDALADVSFIIAKYELDERNPEAIWCRNRKGIAYDAIKSWRKMKYNQIPNFSTDDFSIYTTSRFPIINNNWNIIPMRDEQFLYLLKNWQCIGKLVPLTDIFDIYQGLLTGKKGIFEISISEYKQLPDDEKIYYRPLINSGTINCGKIQIKNYIWFPYNKNGVTINSENDLQRLRETWNHIAPYRAELKTRKSVKNWWELTRPRTWQFSPKFRLYSMRFGNSSSFGIGEEDNYVIEEGNAFEFKQSEKYQKDDFFFYLSLFSSNIFERLLSIYSKRILAGYDLGKAQIKDIPIIDVKENNIREGEPYKKMVTIGKMLSQGDSYMQNAIDNYIQIFYPDYER